MLVLVADSTYTSTVLCDISNIRAAVSVVGTTGTVGNTTGAGAGGAVAGDTVAGVAIVKSNITTV